MFARNNVSVLALMMSPAATLTPCGATLLSCVISSCVCAAFTTSPGFTVASAGVNVPSLRRPTILARIAVRNASILLALTGSSILTVSVQAVAMLTSRRHVRRIAGRAFPLFSQCLLPGLGLLIIPARYLIAYLCHGAELFAAEKDVARVFDPLHDAGGTPRRDIASLAFALVVVQRDR